MATSNNSVDDLTHKLENLGLKDSEQQLSKNVEAGSRPVPPHRDKHKGKKESTSNQEEVWTPPKQTVSEDEALARQGKKANSDVVDSGQNTTPFNAQENSQSRTAVKKRKIKIDSQDHKLFLDEFHFKDYYMKKDMSLTEDFKYTCTGSDIYLECQCSLDKISAIEMEMSKFISSIQSKKLPLDSGILEILFTQEGKSFLKNELKKQKVHGLWKKENSCTVRIFAKQANMEKVLKTIQECFTHMEVSVQKLEYFYFTTPSFQKLKGGQENKTLKVERKLGSVSFAATKPIADEIYLEMQKYSSPQVLRDLSLTWIQTEAIKQWGENLGDLKDVEKKMKFLNQLHSEGRYLCIDTKLLGMVQAKKYVDDMLKESRINALYETESRNCLNIIACNENEAARAEKVLRDALKTKQVYYTDEMKERLQSELLKKLTNKYWEGKYSFEELDTEEGWVLLATNDVIEAIIDFLNDKNPTDWEKKYERSLKRAVLTELVMSHENIKCDVEQIGKKFHCNILRKTLEPQLAKCWVLEREQNLQNPQYIRVHHIAEHAESLNVDVLMCPCTSFLWPLKECFLQCVKDILPKTDKRYPVGSVEEIRPAPDGFGCQKIMYLIMCEPNSFEKLADLKSMVIDALLEADKLSYTSVAFPILPQEVMGIKEQAKEISRAISHFVKRSTKLENVEEIFFCECSGKLTEEIQQQWDKMLCSVEGYIDFKHLHQSAVGMATHQAYKSSDSAKIRVQIIEDSLALQKVDVLVNTCRRDLDLSQGAVSSSILNKGGSIIQEDIKKNYPNGIKYADVAVTVGGHLNCRHVFHSALYPWTPHGNFSLKVLKLMIWNCLAEADNRKCKTIAFPSLGTGRLKYPFQLVAETVYHTIECYEQRNKKTQIRNVVLVLYEKDLECTKQFKATEQRRSQIFPSREEKHPSEFLTSSVQSILVDLLPSASEWRWGCLLKISFNVEKEKNTGPVWDDSEGCWKLLIDQPSYSTSVSSWLSNPIEGILEIKRISSVELTLVQEVHCRIEAQLSHFFYLLKKLQKHFIQHVFIVFPSEETFKSSSKYWETVSKNSPLKKGRRKFLVPIIYEINGDAQDVLQAKEELRSNLTKVEEKKMVKSSKLQNATKQSSVKVLVSTFI